MCEKKVRVIPYQSTISHTSPVSYLLLERLSPSQGKRAERGGKGCNYLLLRSLLKDLPEYVPSTTTTGNTYVLSIFHLWMRAPSSDYKIVSIQFDPASPSRDRVIMQVRRPLKVSQWRPGPSGIERTTSTENCTEAKFLAKCLGSMRIKMGQFSVESLTQIWGEVTSTPWVQTLNHHLSNIKFCHGV